MQQLAQRAALDVLHDDVRQVDDAAGRLDDLLLAGVVDRDDRRVVQRGRGLRLAPEPGLERGVARQVGAQQLDGDDAAEPGVAPDVDLGHAAAAEQLADLVAVAQHVGPVVHRIHPNRRPVVPDPPVST